jgi:hypothetical protein
MLRLKKMYFEGNLTMHYFALLSEKYYCLATFHAGKWLKTALFQANTLSFGIVDLYSTKQGILRSQKVFEKHLSFNQ